MCKFIGKSNGRILCKQSKSEILRLYSIVQVAMETTKTSYSTRPSSYSLPSHLPSFSFWAATFLLPWFGKWHILTNWQNCVQPPYAYPKKRPFTQAQSFSDGVIDSNCNSCIISYPYFHCNFFSKGDVIFFHVISRCLAANFVTFALWKDLK